MTEVGFYHLTTTSLERALPRLLEKALGRGLRAVVLAESAERVATLDAALWTFDDASFLPHGTAADGNADRQPIYLTHQDENPNGAALLVLVDGLSVADLSRYQRCLDLFDGANEAAVAAARRRWQACKAAGHTLTYWQQSESGGWVAK
jgi:DNA polymerase III subunit chi